MGSRAEAEALAIKLINKVDRSGKSGASLQAQFQAMTNAQFESFAQAMEAKKAFLPILMDNLQGNQITFENNLKVGKELGVEFFQRVEMFDSTLGLYYWSNDCYLVCDVPFRRMAQTLESKISLPDDNKHVDDLTDQPTGVSKGSSMSAPETLIIIGQGAEKAALELVSVRGGDLAAMRAMEQSIHDTGGASLEHSLARGEGAKSTATLSTMLAGMHFDNNLVE